MRFIILYCLIMLTTTACDLLEKKENKAPIAHKVPYSFTVHNTIINDEYAWLRDQNWPKVEDPKILAYLQEENKYSEQFFTPLKDERKKIFEELKGRIELVDQSTYLKKDDYYYYTRTEEDKEYKIYCRKKGSIEGTEEILLDVNELAQGKNFTQIGYFDVSPNHKLMLYSVDFTGGEKYTARVYNLETKEYLADEVENTLGELAWHENNAGFFYAPVNEHWRTDKAMFHKLGTKAEEDKLILHETDKLYEVSVERSGSHKYIFINTHGFEARQVHVIDMQDENFTPKLIRPKEEQIHYFPEHNGDYFYIRTNKDAKNYKVVRVPLENFANASWEDYIKEDAQSYLTGFDITNNYILLNYKNNALPLIKVKSLHNDTIKSISFQDAVFVANGYSTNFDEDDIRVNYASLVRPQTYYSYDFAEEKLNILKVQKIPSGFNPDEYTVERQWADNQGVKIPLTIFYKKSLFKHDGSNPLYLYGYGSYGISIEPLFSNFAVTLANRGVVYVMAHIRGGQELGENWYKTAKFLTKKRTFEDFIRSAEYLISAKYTKAGNIAIYGGSAGGMLIGAVINERPELFKAAIADVPFVDVLNTMLDDSLPLTPGEYKEWGNPKEKEYFEYMRSYSPYDNIKAQNYPALRVTAGISDPRVGYWEAAKWVARLREIKTDNNPLIFDTNLDAGHMGASGRFDYLKEAADDILFVLKIFNLKL